MKKMALLFLFLSLDVASVLGQVTYLPVSVAFPHITIGGTADGINFVALLQIANNNSTFTAAHISLFADDGSALPALFDGDGPQSTMDLKLDSGQTKQIQLTRSGGITSGWMEIDWSPNDAQTSLILQFRSGTTLLSEVGVNPAFDLIANADF